MLKRQNAHDAVERRLRDQAARREIGALEREPGAPAPACGGNEAGRDVDAEHRRAPRSERARDAALTAAGVEPVLPAHAAERREQRAVEETRAVRIALDPADPGPRVRVPIGLQRWSISLRRSRASFASPVLGYFSISVPYVVRASADLLAFWYAMPNL